MAAFARRGGLAWGNSRWIAVFFAPLLVDVLIGNTPLSRFATGIVAAFPVALLLRARADGL